jgi:hypothetical protein
MSGIDNLAPLDAMDGAEVTLVGIRPAGELTDRVGPRSLLHAGPPVSVDELAGPMRGAVWGALLLEGEAGDEREAEALLEAGEVALAPCHEADAVGALAGVISPSLPCVVAETASGRRVFSPLYEGTLLPSLRYGAYGPQTLARLRFYIDELCPALDAAIRASEPIDLRALQAEGLLRGDECHSRNAACTGMLVLRLAPALARVAGGDAPRFLADLAANPNLFLTFSMVAAKAMTLEAQATGEGSIVTALCANGRRFGIRVSGCGDRWFTSDLPAVAPKLLPGFTPEDLGPLMGDSFIVETAGLGAFAISAAPGVGAYLGSTPAQHRGVVAAMADVTGRRSARNRLPEEGFPGAPMGIDVVKVAERRRPPYVNCGFAHRSPGVGQVAAGLLQVPFEPFAQAAAALAPQAAAA